MNLQLAQCVDWAFYAGAVVVTGSMFIGGRLVKRAESSSSNVAWLASAVLLVFAIGLGVALMVRTC